MDDDVRRMNLTVRVNPHEHAALELVAQKMKLPTATYARQTLLADALRRIVQGRTVKR
jgi:hypothetical protein